MGREEARERPNGDRASDTASFRRLVEDKISVEEYVERIEQRVRERRINEETLRRARTGAEPQRRR
jgi:hypothetical protein